MKFVSFMKKFAKYLLLISSLGLLTSCFLASPGKKTTSSEPSTTSTSSNNTESTITTTIDESRSYTFHTSGSYLPFDDYGIHISDEASGYENRDSLKNAINTEVGKNLVSSLSASNCTILTDDGTKNQQHLHLTIGTGSDGGYIQFDLSMNILKVQIEVIPYYKQGYSLDTNSTVYIDNDEHKIASHSESSTQSLIPFDKTYSTAVNTFKLSNKLGKQRFFIESVKVYY